MEETFYYICGSVLLLIGVCIAVCEWRKHTILLRLAGMTDEEKNKALNALAEPFGYAYVPEWDVFSSRVDAWQKQFGYGVLYDRAASYFHMVLDTLPIYFDYQEETWLIQIWKGQYGICTGCEVGIYHADHLVSEKERATTIFRAVDEQEMPRMATGLWREGRLLAALKRTHWWLTTFDVGNFSKPSQLRMGISIQFADAAMRDAFCRALIATGMNPKKMLVTFTTVHFYFPMIDPELSSWQRFQRGLAQLLNRINSRIFHLFTRCCNSTRDQILYLSFYFPVVCRHVLKLRHAPKKRR
ncbi:MAG: DUF4474 domain-containing protein [bacterium]|nr:DUF4474 domain-containing protein [bacterium]